MEAFEKILENKKDDESIIEYISKCEIGRDMMINTPFGSKTLVYCDYTASGRALTFIENFIQYKVLPFYANIHAAIAASSDMTTNYRNEARESIKKCVNASKDDLVIFIDSGVTGAINKLKQVLELVDETIVFLSPFENHSNILPWREIGAEIVFATEANDGTIDLVDLEKKLKRYENDRRSKIASFSVGSNISGVLVDTEKITLLFHKYGFYSFWDYAAGAPHVKIDMNPSIDVEAAKDAIFVSTNKLIGGPQTPGILIAKRSLFTNKVENKSLLSVENDSKSNHIEEFEESSSPSIVESIRAGLVFYLKNQVQENFIIEKEDYFTNKVIQTLSNIPNFHLLGSTMTKRLSIFSFMIQDEKTGLYLHANFVTVLLNDLFGIQTRSGCACTGPYVANLIGMTQESANEFENILDENEKLNEISKKNSEYSTAKWLKPAFTRFNISFFFEEEKVDYVLNAIKFVCKNGWKYLPLYKYDYEKGIYKYRNIDQKLNVKTDSHLSYEEKLKSVYLTLPMTKKTIDTIEDERFLFSKKTSDLRWFLLSSEAYGFMHDKPELYSNNKLRPVFRPRKYPLSSPLTNFTATSWKFRENSLDENENDIDYSLKSNTRRYSFNFQDVIIY